MSYEFRSLSQVSDLLERKELSPVELVQNCLDRIEQVDPRLNSFITLTGDRALNTARQAERQIMQGERSGPLHGIPLAYKDLFETRGVRTTAGSRFFADYVPQEDAYVIEKLAAAGAISLGKLNMHEIALGVTNVNPHYGACRNPWNTQRMTGGSSGGSAAALGGGLCYGSLGTDTGGSIRIPASLCGIVGLKPTRGRISLRGVIPLSWNLDHAGPMARNVRDVALIFQAIAGYDPLDPYARNEPVPDVLSDLEKGVQGWRVALAVGEFFEPTQPEVAQLVRQAAKQFEALGAAVEEVDFSKARDAALANSLMTTSDAAAFHRDRLAEHPEEFGDDILQRLRTGAAYTSTEYILARRTQSLLRDEFTHFYDQYDLLLMPATPVTAPPIDGPDAIEQARLLTRYTAPFNLTGLPALSLPCGFTSEGLPAGLQMIARPWAEAALLRAACAYEQAAGWHKAHPDL